MSPASADDLPSEVLYNIAPFIQDRSTSLKLRSTSRRYKQIFTPFVGITSLTIRLSKKSTHFNEARNHLLPFEPVPDVFIQYISSLKVLLTVITTLPNDPDLSPVWSELQRLTYITDLTITCVDPFPYRAFTGLRDTELVDKALGSVLSATNGRLLRLRLDGTSPTGMETLRSFPQSLQLVRGVEVVDLTRSHCSTHGRCASSPTVLIQTREFIQNNPSIKDLTLVNVCPEIALSLEDIFASRQGQMALNKLTVFSYILPPQSTSFTIPSLTNLRNLIISSPPKESTIWSTFACDPLWVALRSSHTNLEALRTGYISRALTDYLSSFEGLKNCTLEITHPIQWDSTTIPPLWQSLAPHASTLQYLSVDCRRPDNPMPAPFSFSPATLPQLGILPWSFPSLKDLVIHCPSDLRLNMSNCQSLLDHLADYPALESVTVRWYMVPRHGAFSGMGDVFLTSTGRPKRLTVKCGHNIQQFNVFSED